MSAKVWPSSPGLSVLNILEFDFIFMYVFFSSNFYVLGSTHLLLVIENPCFGDASVVSCCLRGFHDFSCCLAWPRLTQTRGRGLPWGVSGAGHTKWRWCITVKNCKVFKRTLLSKQNIPNDKFYKSPFWLPICQDGMFCWWQSWWYNIWFENFAQIGSFSSASDGDLLTLANSPEFTEDCDLGRVNPGTALVYH